MKKMTLFLLALTIGLTGANAQTNKKPEAKTSELIVSCSAEYVQPKTLIIWWSETHYDFPARIEDGFHGKVYLGQASASAFTWDRGSNIARLDRYTGLLSLTAKDGSGESTGKCVKVEKKF